MALTALVLGAAAGGGFPQWNCRCAVCRLAWAGDPRVRARTQASVAVSADRQRWTLLNASPDLRSQLLQQPALQPPSGAARELRASPVAAVVLTGAEIDQITGLLTMRERWPFELMGTAATLTTLDSNAMFGALDPTLVPRRAVTPDRPFDLPGGLQAELFVVPGKVPLYLEDENPETAIETAANVGVDVTHDGKHLLYIPGAAAVTPALRTRMERADVILFDGTLFTDDEMIRSGAGVKTGRRMGHMPIDGADGSLAALADLSARRIYIHINNTNPILIEDSPERRRVELAGFEVAHDGMEIVL